MRSLGYKVSPNPFDPCRSRPSSSLDVSASRVAYNAGSQGWNPQAFRDAVDRQGAVILLTKASRSVSNNESKEWFGDYNPKGWSSLGGARPSVAAFLWYTTTATTYTNKSGAVTTKLQKLRKVGGGGLACAKDDDNTDIWLGADGLVIPLEDRHEPRRRVQSKLGPYFERVAVLSKYRNRRF
jgi:hypothetical protein